MPTQQEVWSHRDSWPPTQMRLNLSAPGKNSEPRPLLEDIDDNPLTYFLTPAAENDAGDIDDDMDFDAGIEDSSHPREIVRSVSPSSLEGLSKLKGRGTSPDFDSDGLTTDDDDDEDYIRFSPGSPSRLTALRNIGIDGLRLRTQSPVFGTSANGLLSAASYPAPQARGRTYARARFVGQTRSVSARSRPGHLWREPSPDVWSIQEEPEEDVMLSTETDGTKEAEVQKLAAKPKKKVRFLLPTKE